MTPAAATIHPTLVARAIRSGHGTLDQIAAALGVSAGSRPLVNIMTAMLRAGRLAREDTGERTSRGTAVLAFSLIDDAGDDTPLPTFDASTSARPGPPAWLQTAIDDHAAGDDRPIGVVDQPAAAPRRRGRPAPPPDLLGIVRDPDPDDPAAGYVVGSDVVPGTDTEVGGADVIFMATVDGNVILATEAARPGHAPGDGRPFYAPPHLGGKEMHQLAQVLDDLAAAAEGGAVGGQNDADDHPLARARQRVDRLLQGGPEVKPDEKIVLGDTSEVPLTVAQLRDLLHQVAPPPAPSYAAVVKGPPGEWDHGQVWVDLDPDGNIILAGCEGSEEPPWIKPYEGRPDGTARLDPDGARATAAKLREQADRSGYRPRRRRTQPADGGGQATKPEEEPVPTGEPDEDALLDQARLEAAELINCDKTAQADVLASGLKGQRLSRVEQVLGVRPTGTVADRRATVVQAAIGSAIRSATIRHLGLDEHRERYVADMAAYRARRLVSIGLTAPTVVRPGPTWTIMSGDVPDDGRTYLDPGELFGGPCADCGHGETSDITGHTYCWCGYWIPTSYL